MSQIELNRDSLAETDIGKEALRLIELQEDEISTHLNQMWRLKQENVLLLERLEKHEPGGYKG